MAKNSKERLRLERVYGGLYQRMENCSLDECWYCSETRETLDHCPPLCSIENLDLELFAKQGGKLLLVPSCTECNSKLSYTPLDSPFERLLYLQEKYMKLIDKFFMAWSEDEISRLGPNLKRVVLAKRKVVDEWTLKLRRIERKVVHFNEED